MKSALTVVGVSFFWLGALGTSPGNMQANRGSADKKADMPGPVLVELFTSEGCSTCPPAEALLQELDERRKVAGADVIVLEEHVDYWNHLGWKDPFSSPQWTERQEEYAAAFHLDQLYTPQMVVDGWKQFVGSQEGQSLEAIREAALKPKVAIRLAVQQETPSRFLMNISVQLPHGEDKHDAEVWLAVTEKGLDTKVLRGENAGDDLRHSEVVRTLRKTGKAKAKKEPSYSGESIVQLHPDWKRENLRFVVFVEDSKSLQVLGAAAIRPRWP